MFFSVTDVTGKWLLINEDDVARFKEAGFEEKAKYKLGQETKTLCFLKPNIYGAGTCIGLIDSKEDIEKYLMFGVIVGGKES